MPGLVPGTDALLAAPKKDVGGRDRTKCPGAAMTKGETSNPRAAPPGGRLVGDAGVAHAVGQALDLLASAEAKIRGTGLVDRPAALSRAQFKQRAAAPVRDGDGFGQRLPRKLHEDLVLGDDPGSPGAAPLLRLPGEHGLGARQAEAVHLADDGIARHSDLGSDLAA